MSQPLDSQFTREDIYHHSYGTLTNFVVKVFAICFCIVSISGVLNGVYWLSFLLPIGVFLVFAKGASSIDLRNKRLKEGVSIFGIRLGTWKILKNISHISVYRNKMSQTVNYMGHMPAFGNMASTTFDAGVDYDIYLVEFNRKKILVASFDESEMAHSLAQQFGDKLELDVYNGPKVDPKTIRNRRR